MANCRAMDWRFAETALSARNNRFFEIEVVAEEVGRNVSLEPEFEEELSSNDNRALRVSEDSSTPVASTIVAVSYTHLTLPTIYSV